MSQILTDLQNPTIENISNTAGGGVASFSSTGLTINSGFLLFQHMGTFKLLYPVTLHHVYAPETPGVWGTRAFFTTDDTITIIGIFIEYNINSTIAANLNFTKDTAGAAPGSGSAVLTDNTGAGIDISAAGNINTKLDGTINNDMVKLDAGEKLSMVFSGAPAGLDKLMVHISYVQGEPIAV